MAADEFGILHIEETQSEEALAQKVDIYVLVRGAALFVGDAALSKAREISALLTELRAISLTDSDFKLIGVQADVSTGIMGRNSSASYRLKIHCERLEALPDVLGVITAQKNAAVLHLEWDYGDLEAIENNLLDRWLERGGQRARRIAAGLNERIAGIQRFEEKSRKPLELAGGGFMDYGGEAASYRSTKDRRVTSQDLGMQISHSWQVSVRVNIEYRLARTVDGGA